MVAENYRMVDKKVQEACARAGRDRNEVTLIAVSKTKPVAMIQEAMAAGANVFGENKVRSCAINMNCFQKIFTGI